MHQISAALYRGNRTFEVRTIETAPPAAGEVQIDVAYCGICGTDLHVYLGHMDQRVGFDRVIGHEMSGIVRAVGEGVTTWAAGDRVVVKPLAPCGQCPACKRGHAHICQNLSFLGLDSHGAFQQTWNVPAHTLHLLPDSISMRDAALIEPVAVAVHAVRRANLKTGEDVLVIGGGPIGMLVAMVARHAGGTVVISEVNEARLAMARDLGFDALNPMETDVAGDIENRTGTKGCDVVFEVSGTQPGVDLMTAVAATRARLVMVAIHAQKPVIDMFQVFWREIELYGARVYEPEDYDEAIRLIASRGIAADALITNIRPLSAIENAFAELTDDPQAMKILIELNGGAA